MAEQSSNVQIMCLGQQLKHIPDITTHKDTLTHGSITNQIMYSNTHKPTFMIVKHSDSVIREAQKQSIPTISVNPPYSNLNKTLYSIPGNNSTSFKQTSHQLIPTIKDVAAAGNTNKTGSQYTLNLLLDLLNLHKKDKELALILFKHKVDQFTKDTTSAQ